MYRSALIEWLEQLGYGAESRWNVVSLRLDLAVRRLENSVNPAVMGTFVEMWEG